MKMTAVTNILIALALSNVVLAETAAYDGLFYMQRIPSSCVATTLNLTANGSVSGNCFTFDWSEITNLTTNYTTYLDPDTNETYYAQIGALTVLGQIDDYDLDYQCPPLGYNGVGPGCRTQPDTELVVLYINVLDGRLYAMDIILSGAPFPAAQDLKENQPPFGKAHHTFNSGVTIQSTGYFTICKSNNSDQCPTQNLTAHKLPRPLPSNYGYGIYGFQTPNFITNSTWIMDDPSQLLIVTAGVFYYYFNSTGFFLSISDSKTCTWSAACNYQCDVYNYDSRFLDYAGEWVITKKWGIAEMEPTAVETWIGNAMDASGIFPVILYLEKKTGHYLGLDKLDPIPSQRMGATYWYTEQGNTTPRVSIEAFHPNVVEAGCIVNISDWIGVQKNTGIPVRSDNVRMMLVLVFLNLCLKYGSKASLNVSRQSDEK